MQETFLHVSGDDVLRAVRDCWASLHSERASAYRERMGAGTPEMGVTVQRMVDADVSGVLFTCNPVSGDPSTVAINASWGLGLAVVGGEVTPDEYLVSKVTGDVRATVGDKHVEYRGAEPRPGRRGAPRGARAWTTRRSARCVDARQARAGALRLPPGRRMGVRATASCSCCSRGRSRSSRTRKPPAGDALSMVMGTFGVRTDGPH